jgi:hypothetical protein
MERRIVILAVPRSVQAYNGVNEEETQPGPQSSHTRLLLNGGNLRFLALETVDCAAQVRAWQ